MRFLFLVDVSQLLVDHPNVKFNLAYRTTKVRSRQVLGQYAYMQSYNLYQQDRRTYLILFRWARCLVLSHRMPDTSRLSKIVSWPLQYM